MKKLDYLLKLGAIESHNMELVITLNQNGLKLEIRQNGRVIDPALEKDRELKFGRRPVLFKGGVDFETAKYYHNLDGVLTPLEVAGIIKRGFIVKDGVAIYGELLTGLISTLDKLLKRNTLDPIRLFSNNKDRHGTQAKSNGAGLEAVKSYKILGNLGTDSTSYKIAAAFIGALKFRDRS